LPVTFYKSVDQLPPFTDYSMKGRTYRFFTGEPLYPFGYGLSYTTFAYRKLSLPKQAKAGAPVTVSVEVENTGAVAGDEVVEMYVKSPAPSLQGFQRIALQPKEKRTVQFTLQPAQLAGPEPFEISVGGKLPGVIGKTLRIIH
jgi:beta-glucosidase